MLKDQVQCKDIVQEAFLRLWDKREEFSSIFSIRSYLYVTVRNLSLNHIRDHRKREIIPDKLPEIPDQEWKSFILEEETVRLLYTAISSLPPQSSRIIQLTVQGLNNVEIATTLGISVNTTKTLKYNALKSLRRILGEDTRSALFSDFIHPLFLFGVFSIDTIQIVEIQDDGDQSKTNTNRSRV